MARPGVQQAYRFDCGLCGQSIEQGQAPNLLAIYPEIGERSEMFDACTACSRRITTHNNKKEREAARREIKEYHRFKAWEKEMKALRDAAEEAGEDWDEPTYNAGEAYNPFSVDDVAQTEQMEIDGQQKAVAVLRDKRKQATLPGMPAPQSTPARLLSTEAPPTAPGPDPMMILAQAMASLAAGQAEILKLLTPKEEPETDDKPAPRKRPRK